MPLLAMAQSNWNHQWPNTDFSKHIIPLDEIISGGPPKDGIPAIDEPQFQPIGEVDNLTNQDPVITLLLAGEARAYPLRILMFHEIANDWFEDIPVAITY